MSNDKSASNILDDYQADYGAREEETLSIGAFLDRCKEDKSAYALASERLLKAFGEPEVIDTSKDPVLGRLHDNREVFRYPAFADFYGVEETIMQIARHLEAAARGEEARKQVLYLLGPVGGGKSSLAERLKSLMEEEPIYVLRCKKTGRLSPNNDTPLSLFDAKKHGQRLQDEYGISPRYLRPVMSPWAVKRLKEAKGNPNEAFEVAKIWPSISKQVAITKTEPGTENNQDETSLIGKVDLNQLGEGLAQNDPDAYLYSGALNMGNQGLVEYVEMFKVGNIKALNPILTATQEGHFNGSEAIGAMPFDGLILAHSNETEWKTFSTNPANEAFLDRVNIVKVPYVLRASQEAEIYKKYIRESGLADAPCAPMTIDLMAQFSVLTRLENPPENAAETVPVSKMRVYDGENLKEVNPKALSLREYREKASNHEGMSGSSTRFGFKTLSETFNHNARKDGISADPVQLIAVLRDKIQKGDYTDEEREKRLKIIDGYMKPAFLKFIDREIRAAFMDSHDGYGQAVFDRYIAYATAWCKGDDYKDPETGDIIAREVLEKELAKIEKPAGVANVKDFRNEVVMSVLQARANNKGENPDWKSYEKLKRVIEETLFSKTGDIVPMVSSAPKSSEEEKKKYQTFLENMKARGNTETMVKRQVKFWENNQPG